MTNLFLNYINYIISYFNYLKEILVAFENKNFFISFI